MATPMATPLRDELGLNDPDAITGASNLSFAQQRRQQAAIRGELRAGLGALPAPQNEYQIELPSTAEGQDDAMMEEEGRVEDEADGRARRAREAEARRQEEEKKKSRALQRGLPRPLEYDFLSPVLRPVEGREGLSVEQKAEELLRVRERERERKR